MNRIEINHPITGEDIHLTFDGNKVYDVIYSGTDETVELNDEINELITNEINDFYNEKET